MAETKDSKQKDDSLAVSHYSSQQDFAVRRHRQVLEDHAVGLVRSHYHPDLVVYTPYGEIRSRDALIQHTINDIGTFPDLKLHGADAITIVDSPTQFVSSFAATIVGINSGESWLGQPTYHRIVSAMAIESEVTNNKILREWQLRDTGSLIRQMGLDIQQAANLMAQELKRYLGVFSDEPSPNSLPSVRPTDLSAPVPDDPSQIPDFIFATIINGRAFHRTAEVYSSDVPCAHLGGTHHGPHGMGRLFLQLVRTFPDFTTRVERVLIRSPYADNNEEGPPYSGDADLAVRWRFFGTHLGRGLFGEPTHRPVGGFAISQYRIESGLIVAERTVLDELAVHVQLNRQN